MIQGKILVVEEHKGGTGTLQALLAQAGVEFLVAPTGRMGFSMAVQHTPDLIFLDLYLPDITGFELCQLLRQNPMTSDVPISMILGEADHGYRVLAFEHGSDQVVHKPFHKAELMAIVTHVTKLNRYRRMAQQKQEVEQMFKKLEHAYDATIEGWVKALDLKDQETEGHSLRVAAMATELARYMGIADDELVHLNRGAVLHDIGKLAIPDAILMKAGKLTEEERAIMQKHPTYAYEMLNQIEYLQPAMDIPYCHHERWDGEGYPNGVKGEDIPLHARLFSIVDVWDALRYDRPYRQGWPERRVLEYLVSQSGTHFDPEVVSAFSEYFRRGSFAAAS